MKNKKTFVALSATGVALAMMLSACGSDGGSQNNEPSSVSSSTPSTAATSSAPTSSSTAGSQGEAKELTAAGTKLKVGETAVTEYVNSKEKSDPKFIDVTFNTTVTDIAKGKEADLAQFEDAAQLKGQTPYYVKVTREILKTTPENAGMSITSGLKGLLSNGDEAEELIVIGSMDQCPTEDWKPTGDPGYPVGAVSTQCFVFMAPQGDEVTQVSYTGDNDSSGENPYEDNPIIWSK